MAVRIKKGVALSSLSLTPLIDVVFLLLIFFLVASRFAQEDREMDFPLPSASEAKPLIVQPRDLFVNIDKDGRVFIDGAPMEAAPGSTPPPSSRMSSRSICTAWARSRRSS